MTEPALRQGWHQWWCPGMPCACLPEFVAWDESRRAGRNVMPLPTIVMEGPPCEVCKGTAEQTEPSGLRMPCSNGDGTRNPKCRGNGGGRMSPAQLAAWRAEQAAS